MLNRKKVTKVRAGVRQKLLRIQYAVPTLVITLSLIFSLVPRAAWADSTCGTFGMGESSGVCLVSDCTQLFSLSSGIDGTALAASYRLTTDVTCPNMLFTPIGTQAAPFIGTFDGDGFTINNLQISLGSGNDGGLFGHAYNAVIKDLTLDASQVIGSGLLGIVVGTAAGNTFIKNTHVTSSNVAGTGAYIGGLAGMLVDEAHISYSSVGSTDVSADSSASGGLVGGVYQTGNIIAINNSYATGARVTGNDAVGGLAGLVNNAEVNNSYSNAELYEAGGGGAGGFVGTVTGATIRNSYSTGTMNNLVAPTGGFIGIVSVGTTIVNSFADMSGSNIGGGFFGSGWGDYGIYPSISNNFYTPNIGSPMVCFAGDDGDESGCMTTYNDDSGRFLNTSNQPVATWDTFSTWDMTPTSGSLPTLFAEGQRVASTITLGTGVSGDPYHISDCHQLQAMDEHLNAYYQLYDDIDCSDTVNWNSGKGFDPVGNNNGAGPFTGNFNGDGKTISNLYINRVNDQSGQQEGDEEFVGLFGYIQNGDAYDVNLTSAKVRGFYNVGGLAGILDNSNIDAVNVNMDVATNDCLVGGHCVWARYGANGGGIVGNSVNNSNITGSNSAGPVKGSGITIGGIVGHAESGTLIQNVNSSSHIDGGYDVGGIVGRLDSSDLVDSHATGDILAQTDDNKPGDAGGGLAGSSIDSTILDSSATGSVEGRDNLGGLVGYTDNSIIISSTSSGSTVEGNSGIGGFAGFTANTEISDSQSTVGDISAISSMAGGFVGYAYCSSTFIQDTASANVNGFATSGGFAGKTSCDTGTGAVFSGVKATGDVDGLFYNGGLIGRSTAAIVDESSATGDVYGGVDNGGLIGLAEGPGRDIDVNPMLVTKSYATGDVFGETYSGGLIGDMSGGVISNTYARGNAYDNDVAGGLVANADGTSAIQFSYATGEIDSGVMSPGGVVSAWGVGLEVTSSFWDATINPDIVPSGFSGEYGVGLTTEELQMQSVLEAANYSFVDFWSLDFPASNDGYACFQWDTTCTNQVDDSGNVYAYLDGKDGAQISIMGSGCTAISSSSIASESELQTKDPGFDYPTGLVSYTLTGCNTGVANVTITFNGIYDLDKIFARKYNALNHSFTTLNGNPNVTVNHTTLGATRVIMTISDGGPLDQDGTVNGTIVDPIGLGTAVVSVPNTGFYRK